MTGLTPGSAMSRLAAIGLLLLVALAAWRLVAAPLVEQRDALDAEIALTRASNARLYAQVGRAPRGADATVLTDASSALAAARLQGILETLVEGTGARIERLEAGTMPRERAGRRLEPVRGTVSFTATTAQLRQALLSIEAAPLAMIAEELVIAPADHDESGRDGQLSAQLAVRAFRSKGRYR